MGSAPSGGSGLGTYIPILVPQIALNKSLESDAFADDVHQIFDAVGFAFAVLANHSAGDDSCENVGVVENCFKGFAADVFKVNVFPWSDTVKRGDER